MKWRTKLPSQLPLPTRKLAESEMERTYRRLCLTDTVIYAGVNSCAEVLTYKAGFMITALGGKSRLHARRWAAAQQENMLPSPKTGGVSDQEQ